MNRSLLIALLLPALAPLSQPAAAQRPDHTSMHLRLNDASGVVVPFRLEDGPMLNPVPAEPVRWGLDVAWDSPDNVRRGTNHIGRDVLSLGRVSFQPSDLVDAEGNLSARQRQALQQRLDHISLSGITDVMLNCDHEVLSAANYRGKPAEWHRVIKATVRYVTERGFRVVSIAPFNEPDYAGWGEGSQADMRAICALIAADPDLAGIRISGGNTLNCDEALGWYEALKPYVTEGNTHQLAGSMESYKRFYQTVRADGRYASADELHNVMEAIVGVHYGMQAGIWWGFDGLARGQFCRASHEGLEIGYAEQPQAWSAASVWKRPSGRVDAFLGASERQALTSTYQLACLDRMVYYDGVGPTATCAVTIPGGVGYQQQQPNAERIVQVAYGRDVPLEPLVAGQAYVVMNAASLMCMGCYNGARGNVQLTMMPYSGSAPAAHQQWICRPVDARSGGDFSYFILRNLRDTTQVADVRDWSTSAGGTLLAYPGALGANEQWAVEYAGEGEWYVRSRHSGLYLEVRDGATYTNAVVQQNEWSGEPRQRWRFLPAPAPLETDAPSAPVGLTATARPGSVRLDWAPSPEADVEGYVIMRALEAVPVADDGLPSAPVSGTAMAPTGALAATAGFVAADDGTPWDVVGRMVAGSSFVDNTVWPGGVYRYVLRAVDRSRNLSPCSAEVVVEGSCEGGLIARYGFNQSLRDTTANLFDAVGQDVAYNLISRREGSHSLTLDGRSAYVQLPAAAARPDERTFALWVNMSTGSPVGAHLIDFGCGPDCALALTPTDGSRLRLDLTAAGATHTIAAPPLGYGWHHLAFTVSPNALRLYVDGVEVGSLADVTTAMAGFSPVFCYIGRGQQASTPLFKGQVDDLCIYDYALSAEGVESVRQGIDPAAIEALNADAAAPAEAVYSLDGLRQTSARGGLRLVRRRLPDGTVRTSKVFCR